VLVGLVESTLCETKTGIDAVLAVERTLRDGSIRLAMRSIDCNLSFAPLCVFLWSLSLYVCAFLVSFLCELVRQFVDLAIGETSTAASGIRVGNLGSPCFVRRNWRFLLLVSDGGVLQLRKASVGLWTTMPL